MKSINLLVSSNGWEYCGRVTLTYRNKFETKMSEPDEPFMDSQGKPTPNQIILDDQYVITFDEGFEISSSNGVKEK